MNNNNLNFHPFFWKYYRFKIFGRFLYPFIVVYNTLYTTSYNIFLLILLYLLSKEKHFCRKQNLMKYLVRPLECMIFFWILLYWVSLGWDLIIFFHYFGSIRDRNLKYIWGSYFHIEFKTVQGRLGSWSEYFTGIQSWDLNHLAIPLPVPVLPIKHGSLNNFPDTHRETLEDHWHC